MRYSASDDLELFGAAGLSLEFLDLVRGRLSRRVASQPQGRTQPEPRTGGTVDALDPSDTQCGSPPLLAGLQHR